MAWCRMAVLGLAVLALVLTGCSAQTGAGVNRQGARANPTASSRAGTPSPSEPASPSPNALPSSNALPSRSPVPDPGRGPLRLITTTGSNAVALTFDDGPGPYTAPLLDLLEKYHVKATFCLVGRQVKTYAAVVRRMVANGMTLCNHTWDHDEGLRYRSDSYIRNDLARTNAAIHAVVPGLKIEYFRNPAGAFGANTVAVARSMGMRSLMWSVDPRDWAKPGTQAIISKVLKYTHQGDIVLSHDGGGGRSQTIAAYRILLPNLRERFKLIAMPLFW
jgi:peptidoglycan/xylan/chitin deacetylase (PgdA/CDA1 family)